MQQGNHGGNIFQAAAFIGCDPGDIRDYSSNVADWQPEGIADIDLPGLLARLPEPHSQTLKAACAAASGLSSQQVWVTAGTTEAIERICQLYGGKRVTILGPTYSDYAHAARQYNLDIHMLLAEPQHAFRHDFATLNVDGDLCFLCNPNNPTATTASRQEVLSLVQRHPRTLFVVDESYLPFHCDEAALTLVPHLTPNLLVLRSFSKIHGIPGLRLGFAMGGSADLLEKLESRCSLWSVNSIAQEMGMRLLSADSTRVARTMAKRRDSIYRELAAFPWLTPLPSAVNFLLCQLHGRDASHLFRHCLQQRVLIRDCSNFAGLDSSCIRFSIKEDMRPLSQAFASF